MLGSFAGSTGFEAQAVEAGKAATAVNRPRRVQSALSMRSPLITQLAG
jgi:hypothetical protein